jgi:hypothetical protein
VLAGLLLLLILSAAWQRRVGWLALLACAGALTRHELTLLMLPIGLWLVWRRRWLAAGGLALGAAVGLGLWSAWSWIVADAPLSWWTRYRALTAWDAQFWTEAGVRLADLDALREAAHQAYPPLTLIVFVFLTALLSPVWRRRVPPAGWLLVGLVAFHWIALSLGFVAGNLPAADPRYLLVSLPVLVGAGVVIIAAHPERAVRLVVAIIYAGILMFSLYGQLPDFRGRAYVLAPERAAGEYLQTQAGTEGSFWVDAPVTIYFSGLDPQRFFSSDELLEAKMLGPGSVDSIAMEAIAAHDIRMVLWENVSYTAVPEVWPQMAAGRPFEQGRAAFVPLFVYRGWELAYGARPTILWEVRLHEG